MPGAKVISRQALEQLAPAIESELHQLARVYLSKEPAGNTLQPTALVNEAYLRLIEWNTVEWQNRTHFYAVAAKIMRRLLVNRAVARRSQKRGGSAIDVSLSEAGAAPDRSAEIIALDQALESLAKFDDRKSRIIELRFFGGLNAEEAAEGFGSLLAHGTSGMGFGAGMAISRASPIKIGMMSPR